MTNKELKDRTQKFALEIIKFVDKLPNRKSSDVLGRQVLRSACAVGANYRAACRAQSYQHFISKISIVEEESDESLFWLELITKAGLMSENEAKHLLKEADELTAIFTAARKTSKANKNLKSKT
jgi:four helix bundle protein